MSYKKLTQKILSLVEESKGVLQHLDDFNSYVTMSFLPDREKKYQKGYELAEDWLSSCTYTLKSEGLQIESYQIETLRTGGTFLFLTPLSSDLKEQSDIVRKSCSILLEIAKSIEDRQEKKVIKRITIEDLDEFKKVYDKADKNLSKKYFNSAFLEDDVEEAFLEILEEPYKEFDSGAETRDLYTSRLMVSEKRKHAVIMFKGRGVKSGLTIKHCGKNGDQLLKLSKNSFANVFCIQHVNKIEPEVLEALEDHLLSHSNSDEIYICPIDGMDTAKLLSGLGRDLDTLVQNKSNAGRKKKSK